MFDEWIRRAIKGKKVALLMSILNVLNQVPVEEASLASSGVGKTVNKLTKVPRTRDMFLLPHLRTVPHVLSPLRAVHRVLIGVPCRIPDSGVRSEGHVVQADQAFGKEEAGTGGLVYSEQESKNFGVIGSI